MANSDEDLLVKILQINRKVLMPIIVSLTVVGAYASRSNLFDVKLMLVFGVIGFFLRKMTFPLAPLTLGLILDPYWMIMDNWIKRVNMGSSK